MRLLTEPLEWVRNSQLWNSLFRHGVPRDRRTRVMAIMSNVFLHLHPVAVRKSGIKALTGEEKLLKRQAIDVADRLLSQLEGKHMIRAWHLDKEIKASGDGGSA